MERKASRNRAVIFTTALVSAALLYVAAFGASAAGSPPATVREVQVELAGGFPTALEGRVREALAAVAAKALQGQELAAVERSRAEVEGAITEVFDRVLAGYRVVAVTVVPGEVTRVRLEAEPEAPLIQEVYTKLQVEGVDPGLQPFLEPLVPELDGAGLALLQGVPVAALAWGKAALQPGLAEKAARLFPGFVAEVGLEAGEVTTVRVKLVPQGERVRRVDVRLASETIPAVALRQLQGEFAERSQLMVGLPVAFLAAYRQPIQEEIDRRVAQVPELQRWGLKARTVLHPDIDTALDLGVESTSWRLRLEGVVNVGALAPGPELRLLSGWSLGPGEVLLRSRTLLTGLTNRLQLGVGVPLGWEGQLSYLWGFDGYPTLRFQKRVSPYQRWGFERESRDGEWRLTYGAAANEHLMAEVVAGRDTIWLSLVGNL
ncbi:MAG TPA: hypothetical protein GXX28_08300 [Firmicutes bacterium]|nr:hypothetical protein [Bacillota bacterium]